MNSLRILIADDHEMIRQGLIRIISGQPGWIVCGEAVNGRQAVQLAHELKPDLVVMDYTMPGLNGMEATRQIRKELPQIEVLVLSMHDSEELVREIIQAGARGYVLKSDAGQSLVSAIKSVAEKKSFFTPRISRLADSVYVYPINREKPCLTPREREIVQLVAEGHSTKQVADILKISVKTCETHRTNILRKLGLRSVSDLVRYAIRNKITEP